MGEAAFRRTATSKLTTSFLNWSVASKERSSPYDANWLSDEVDRGRIRLEVFGALMPEVAAAFGMELWARSTIPSLRPSTRNFDRAISLVMSIVL